MGIRLLEFIRSSLVNKLILSYLFISFIPISAGSIFINDYVHKTVGQEYLSAVGNNLIQLDYSIGKKVDLYRQATKIVSADNNVETLIQSGCLTDSTLIQTIAYGIVPKLEEIKGQNVDIYKLRLIHDNPIIPDVYDTLYYDKRFLSEYWNDKLKALRTGDTIENTEIYIEKEHQEEVYLELQGKDKKIVFSIYRPLYSVYTNRIVGIVELDVLKDVFLDSLKAQKLNAGEMIQVIDDNGTIVYSNNGSLKNHVASACDKARIPANVKFNGEKYYSISRYVASIGSYIVLYIPEKVLRGSSNYRIILFIVLIASMVTLGALSFLMSKVMLSRLMKLTHAINAIKSGNLETRVNIDSHDEIGKLACNFNEMVDEIKKLMSNIEQLNQAEQESIYKTLEAQIQPHFLCNALDMIRMTAEVQDNRVISNAAALIASYFMYNFKKKQKYVSFRDELKNVTDYIEIHNLVSYHKVRYQISVSSEISGYLDEYAILKFVLQPIVENSIRHGFKENDGNNSIFINVNYLYDTIRIVVEDNGVGISPSRLQEIKDYLNRSNDGDDSRTLPDNIGLRNIQERLIVNHGTDHGLELESYPGIGTYVTLEVPVIKCAAVITTELTGKE